MSLHATLEGECPHCGGSFSLHTTAVGGKVRSKAGRKPPYSLSRTGESLLREVAGSPPVAGGEAIVTPEVAFAALQDRCKSLRQECFWAILLDGRRRLIKVELVSRGTLTMTLVHPREVFAPAIAWAAASIVVAHNHPSGLCDPSPEDITLTRRLQDSGSILGIEVVDHIIIGRGAFCSLRQRGEMR